MASDVRFVQNPRFVPEVAVSPRMVEIVRGRAADVQRAAEALAPTESGRYKASFRTYSYVAKWGRFPRAVATVVNEAPYSAAVEFGNSRARGQHVLARALASLVAP